MCICLSNTQFISNCFSEIAVILKTLPSLRVEPMSFFLEPPFISVFRCNLVMSSETGCSVSESTYIRTEKERYFSGVRNVVIYLVEFST